MSYLDSSIADALGSSSSPTPSIALKSHSCRSGISDGSRRMMASSSRLWPVLRARTSRSRSGRCNTKRRNRWTLCPILRYLGPCPVMPKPCTRYAKPSSSAGRSAVDSRDMTVCGASCASVPRTLMKTHRLFDVSNVGESSMCA